MGRLTFFLSPLTGGAAIKLPSPRVEWKRKQRMHCNGSWAYVRVIWFLRVLRSLRCIFLMDYILYANMTVTELN